MSGNALPVVEKTKATFGFRVRTTSIRRGTFSNCREMAPISLSAGWVRVYGKLRGRSMNLAVVQNLDLLTSIPNAVRTNVRRVVQDLCVGGGVAQGVATP